MRTATRLALKGISKPSAVSARAAVGCRRAGRRRSFPQWLLSVIAVLCITATAAAADVDPESSIEVGGVSRGYRLHLPPQRAAVAPLVVVLHGGGGSAQSAIEQTGFDAESDRSGFIVVYPEGSDRVRPMLNAMGRALRTWNAGGCCGYAEAQNVDDVAFIRALVGSLTTHFSIDRQRIYATGISNGGMMSYRLACEASDLFAAVGVVSGVIFTPCAPTHPVAVLHIHGSDDQRVPLAGGVGNKGVEKTPKPPVADSIAFWVHADGCDAKSPRTTRAGAVTRTLYSPCKAGTAVEFDLIEGGEHAWPGGKQMASFLDKPSTAMDATPAIWHFFAGHPQQPQ